MSTKLYWPTISFIKIGTVTAIVYLGKVKGKVIPITGLCGPEGG